MNWKSARRAAENPNFEQEWDDFDRQVPEYRHARPRDQYASRQLDSFEAAQERLLACCDSLRRALDDIEQTIEAREAPHRPAFHRPAPPETARAPGQADSETEPTSHVTMRDMTGFLLSKEGDRFLNLLRRMIREEVEKGQAAEPDPRASRGNDEVEGLRSLIRRRMRRD